MKYFYTGDYYIPKHCKFGPRPAEGVIFSPYEWSRITDQLVKWEKEKASAFALAAREEAKKQQSLGMTKTWQNTLTSIKTQGEQKRLEKTEKDKQKKINEYNEILENRKKEQNRVLEKARKVFYEDKDTSKTILSSFLHSAVLHERSKQIEFKNNLKKKSKIAEQEFIDKIKKDVEIAVKEKREEEINKKLKIQKFKKIIDEQVADFKMRNDSSKESELEKTDLINMENEIKEIKKCEREEKLQRKRQSQELHNKAAKELELEETLKREEKEENELNQIYLDYSRKFERERRLREKEKRQKLLDHREKASEKIASLIAASKGPQFELKSHNNQEDEEKKNSDEAEEKKRKMLELKEERKNALEKFENDKLIQKEINKWQMVQNFKREEINEEWKKNQKIKKRQEKEKMRENLFAQIKEKEERLKKEREADFATESETAYKDELLKYLDYAIEYTKQAGWPEYPVRATVAKIKKENFLDGNKEKLEGNSGNQSDCCRKPKEGPLGSACYCFKC